MPKIHRNPNGVNPLKLGVTADNKEILVSDQSLINNGLVVIGSKNTGKSSLIPDFFQQEVIAPYTEEDGTVYYPVTSACIVVVTAKRNQSYELYGLGRKLHRTSIRFLKPSASFDVKSKLLGMEKYNYDQVNQIIDFVHALQEKEVVIIDMEVERYGEAAIQAVGMLLMQLQIAIHNTAVTNKRRCYLIIDDAFLYLPYLEVLLRYGSEYNLSTIMMFDSCKQYEKYQTLVETNMQNYLLMSNLYYDDADYFSKRFLLDSPRSLMGQGKENCFSFVFDDNMKSQSGPFKLQGVMDDHDRELMYQSGLKYKKSLDKQGGDEEYMAFIMKSYAEYVIQTNRNFKPGSWASATAQAVQKRTELMEQSQPEDNKVALLQRTTGAVPPPQKKEVSVTSPAPTEDFDDTTLTTHMKRQPAAVGAPIVPKKKKEAVSEQPGMKALLGAVEAAPPRLKEKLAEKGITEDSIKHVPKMSHQKSEQHARPENSDGNSNVSSQKTSQGDIMAQAAAKAKDRQQSFENSNTNSNNKREKGKRNKNENGEGDRRQRDRNQKNAGNNQHKSKRDRNNQNDSRNNSKAVQLDFKQALDSGNEQETDTKQREYQKRNGNTDRDHKTASNFAKENKQKNELKQQAGPSAEAKNMNSDARVTKESTQKRQGNTPTSTSISVKENNQKTSEPKTKGQHQSNSSEKISQAPTVPNNVNDEAVQDQEGNMSDNQNPAVIRGHLEEAVSSKLETEGNVTVIPAEGNVPVQQETAEDTQNNEDDTNALDSQGDVQESTAIFKSSQKSVGNDKETTNNSTVENDREVNDDRHVADLDKSSDYEIPDWIDDLDMTDTMQTGTALNLDKNMVRISELPKSADEVFSDQTQKFLEMMRNEGSRPSFFSHRKEIEEMERKFNKK